MTLHAHMWLVQLGWKVRVSVTAQAYPLVWLVPNLANNSEASRANACMLQCSCFDSSLLKSPKLQDSLPHLRRTAPFSNSGNVNCYLTAVLLELL